MSADDILKRAHIIPEPAFVVPTNLAAQTYGRQFERLFPGQPCFYCGDAPNSVDHLVPRSRGGKDGANLVPCCFRCNQMKGNQMLEEFVQRMRLILETLERKGVIQAGELVF